MYVYNFTIKDISDCKFIVVGTFSIFRVVFISVGILSKGKLPVITGNCNKL